MVNKRFLLFILIGLIIAFVCGFFTGKAVYDKPFSESVKTDTVTIHDTIPDYTPEPKDSAFIKYVTKWFPVVQSDTVTEWSVIQTHDTVAVAVPITSKHYGSERYDLWVSGFEPNLDSIKIYSETQYITTTITKIKPPNKLSLDVHAGVNYAIKQQIWTPYALGKVTFNNHKRLSFGVYGGIMSNEKFQNIEPIAGGELKIKIH